MSEISKQLETDIKSSLGNVYGVDKVEEMFGNVLKIVAKARLNRPAALEDEDIIRDSSWYKDEIMYTFYADQFGVEDENTANTFKDLIEMLPYLKDLGVTTVYILPFMDSPMGDAGFDVLDPQNVRTDLGGTNEFKEFMVEMKKHGLKIQADLVLNHFSDQHKWFKEILNGNVDKLDYFLFREELPKYREIHDSKGTIIEYDEDGVKTRRRMIFTDVGENTHYRKINICGKDYYFYHTFYPFQLDINWKNPEVLYYVLETIAYWNNFGIDIFRLDAIPFLIKEKGTNAENLPETHDIVKILSSFNQAIGPRSILHAEACERPKDIIHYFGKERTFNIGSDKILTRTDEVQVAYNFPYMPAIWASLITGSNEYFWNTYEEIPTIPDSASWAQFLRVHDELTLEMVDDTAIKKIICKELAPKGDRFKDLGVSGRMANFLDNNSEKICLAFAILLSLPGIPVIYYGDEIGAQNNLEYGKKAAQKRKEVLKEINENLDSYDSRDINRGPILKDHFYNSMRDGETLGNVIYKTVKNLIRVRKETPALRRGKLSKIPSDKKEIFSYLIISNDQQLIVINNLTENKLKTSLTLPNNLVETLSKKIDMINLINGTKTNVCLRYGKLDIDIEPCQTLWLS
ncbi:MAG: alpha-amylase family glycosyl hydrolase [Methanosarcina sp.]|jgi:maltose alpha-D-glucosyltransferase/alpha-amylase|nr:alpha-amylase family glycosyl hydrolase [Methanosarcina sp.]MDD3316947.1 alpha-amylase family glycosyl hydrolase [Methanosarcina sp.]MDD4305440.1 alpha-amylase family glycosyl hydrolase [Methanosarcina sp.]MDD4620490.1 alpha-amylase family glycosyl hydrolase [Methanosarcina sp.]NLN43773.1 hypothetical protein [Methanosarcina sp.]